jgi:hypothetical protein
MILQASICQFDVDHFLEISTRENFVDHLYEENRHWDQWFRSSSTSHRYP